MTHVQEDGELSEYTSHSSCHSLNSGSDSDGISYHRYHEFDPNMQMDQPALSIGLSFKDVNMLRMVLRQYAV